MTGASPNPSDDPRVHQLALDEACKQSFWVFIRRFYHLVGSGPLVPNWHHQLLAHEFELILRGDRRRLLVTIAPRSLKSIIATVLFPAWALGRNPKLQFICASYSMDLALKFGRDCRSVMRDANYRRVFPGSGLDPAKQSEQEFLTLAGGSRRAVSVGSTLTGFGADHIVCDDLMNAMESGSRAARNTAGDWMDGVMRSRLNSPTRGSITIIAQRLHEDDPIGRILDREPDLWRYVDIPAIAEARQVFDLGRGRTYVREVDELLEPERMPLAYLEEQKRVIGALNFNAQYQQRPSPESGNLVKREWFQWYDEETYPWSEDSAVFQSWDLAMKADQTNDYTVGITALVDGAKYKTGDIYILDVIRKKMIYPEQKRAIIKAQLWWQPRMVVIEDKGSGTPLIQDLKSEGTIRPYGYNPSGDKVQRLSLQSAKIEQGRVFLPRQAAWTEDLLAELLAFPSGKHDDQVDALSQLLDYLDVRAKKMIKVQPY